MKDAILFRELVERMVTIRLVEERLQTMCKRGEAGDLHFSRGQEAIAVGVCAALRPSDHIVTSHRTIAHEIAKGADLYPLIAEILGKRTGVNGGYAGEMHISNPSIRHDFSFQLVGTSVPVAVGLAWALKNYKKNDEIVAVFFGDAATSNGAVHEALTIASIHRVPILLVCENNGVAGNIKKDHYLPTNTVAERMAAYDIDAWVVDGNGIEAVYNTAGRAAETIRNNPRPFLLECETVRLCHHKQGQGDLRTKEQLEELSIMEPLRRISGPNVPMPDPLIAGTAVAHGFELSEVYARVTPMVDEVFARVALDAPPEMRADD